MIDIDTRIGTANHFAYSNGNTLPYTGLPWGMNYLVLQTQDDKGAWFFDPNLPIFQGFRITHQPSPWMGDFAWFLLTPFTGPMTQEDLFHRQSSYDPKKSRFQPHRLKIKSLRYQISSQASATHYGVLLESKSQSGPLRLLIHAGRAFDYKQKDAHQVDIHLQEETAHLKASYNFYLSINSQQSIEKIERLGQDIILTLGADETLFTIGTSFISPEQACHNRPRVTMEEHLDHAEKQWSTLLNRVRLLDAGQRDPTFFKHCLYRVFLFPQRAYERDPSGNPLHWNFAASATSPGKSYMNIGFWDAYRTLFPLYELLIPDLVPEFIEGFLTHYRETGFLPKWLSPDERGLMPGSLIDSILASACAKDLVADPQEILDAMVSNAQRSDPKRIYGRHHPDLYQDLGYLPADCHESVSHTLEYAISDGAIAFLAGKMGQHELHETFEKRSKSYRNLYNPEQGFMQARKRDGSFVDDFDDLRWGRDTAECSSWQTSLGVPHDIEGLKEVRGGQSAFTKYLLDLVNQKTLFHVDGYGYEIHEMSEMALAPFGQMAISNQPSFTIPYLFRYSDQASFTAYLIDSIRQETFQPTFDGYPGDEDNGSLSAWYILSALGIYPICPWKNRYELGLPLFPKLEMYRPNTDDWLTIQCQQESSLHRFVSQVTLDGQERDHISYEELLKAKEISFTTCLLPEVQRLEPITDARLSPAQQKKTRPLP